MPDIWDGLEDIGAQAEPQTAQPDELPDIRKEIIFYDENYREKFRIKDGDRIKITAAKTGDESTPKCRLLNGTHIKVGGTCFHEYEFAETMAREGYRYEPLPGQMPIMDAVISEPGKPPRSIEIPLRLSALRELIGSDVLITSHGRLACVQRKRDGVGGTQIICGTDGKNLTSLHLQRVPEIMRDMAKRMSLRAEPEKPSIAERLKAGKQKAAKLGASRPAPAPGRSAGAVEIG